MSGHLQEVSFVQKGDDLLDLAVINAEQIFYATHEHNSIFPHFANCIFIGYLNRLLLIDVVINMFFSILQVMFFHDYRGNGRFDFD
jgi:hypothetical protein